MSLFIMGLLHSAMTQGSSGRILPLCPIEAIEVPDNLVSSGKTPGKEVCQLFMAMLGDQLAEERKSRRDEKFR